MTGKLQLLVGGWFYDPAVVGVGELQFPGGLLLMEARAGPSMPRKYQSQTSVPSGCLRSSSGCQVLILMLAKASGLPDRELLCMAALGGWDLAFAGEPLVSVLRHLLGFLLTQQSQSARKPLMPILEHEI